MPAEQKHFDVLVLGSGVAGLSAAVRLAGPTGGGLSVCIVTKGELSQSATSWAQGGVAAVLGGDEDSTDLHLADTLAAGAGLCDVDAVRVLVDEGPLCVQELIALGAEFDRETSGHLSLAREGGHSRARVVHAGGAATGYEVERALVDAIRASASAIYEHVFALDLLVEQHACVGVRVLDQGEVLELRADHTILATGGAGQVFAVTTNPSEATGDGLAMAMRAKVAVADVEFMQFHPTALHHPAMPRPLLSEALRGHGAILRDQKGEQFVDELAPRDVVSRAMAARMAEEGSDHLWLDATGLEQFSRRFPTLAASLKAIELDPAVSWIPIAPAAHHLAGGVMTDLDGATSLEGLSAAGEVACSGVHGANRLASNSLLEGMVFGARVADRILHGGNHAELTGVMVSLLQPQSAEIPATILRLPASTRPDTLQGDGQLDVAALRERLQRAMTHGAGVVRTEASLRQAQATVEQIDAELRAHGRTEAATVELCNLLTVARGLLMAAISRTESRGNHARAEYLSADPTWRRRQILEEDEA